MRKIQIVFFTVFFLLISGIGIITLNNHHANSSLEGRKLAKFPKLSMFVSDPYKAIAQSNDAFSDQIAFRKMMIQSYNHLTVQGLHQTYMSDVVVGKGNEMYQAPTSITDKVAYQKNLDHCAEMMNSQAQPILDKGIPFIFISYPQKDVVMQKNLPSYYPATNKIYKESMKYLKSKLMDGIQVIDGADLFIDGDMNKFYYTQDHHANIRGQQLIYEQVMKIMKQDFPQLATYSLDDYIIEDSVVKGAFNRKLGNIIETKPEELYLTPRNAPYTYTRYDEGNVSDLPLMKHTGAYTAYMSGDFAETRIIRDDNKNAPKVFISGSSFSNALEYLLIANTREMLSIDYRHNKSGLQLKDYVEKEQPDYVIFIPSQSTGSFLDYMYKQHLGLSDTSKNE